jgi:two-component system, LuxR family, response regulator FixJ
VPNSAQGCLLLDIHLPGLGGREALKRMIKSKTQRPIIIITADKDADVKRQVLETGAVGFLQKPFHDHELVCLVNKAC